MTEPAGITISTFAAGLSAGSLALFGVTYHGLLWALLGAIVSLMFAPPQSRKQALAAVIGGMLGGAVLSDLAQLLLPSATDERVKSGVHLALAFGIGYGAKALMAAALESALKRIRALGGRTDG